MLGNNVWLSDVAPCAYDSVYRYMNMYLYYKMLVHFSKGVSVEAVDPVFQAKMLDMLKQTGR